MSKKLEKYLLELCEEKDKELLKKIPPENIKGAPPGMEEFKKYPHLFVLGAIMDTNIKASQAWEIPYKIASCLGGKDFSLFSEKDLEYYYGIFEKGPEGKSLHRYKKRKAKYFYKGIQEIENKYDGDASNIWKNNPHSCVLIRRFQEFEGVGQKISSMAVNILRRDYKISISDLSSIDISADVHLKRIFKRMGFIQNEDKESAIIQARKMNPNFPGIFDYVIWTHGVEVCKKNNPLCVECEFDNLCPKNI